MSQKRPKIAVDFDGTIVDFAFPAIGNPLPDAIRVLKRLSDADCKLIVWTCREDEGSKTYLTDAVKFLRSHGIKVRSANETHADDEFRPPSSKRRKVFADIYLDDRNFPRPDMQTFWKQFELYAENCGWLEPEASLVEKDPWKCLQQLYEATPKGSAIWYFTISPEWSNIIQYDMLNLPAEHAYRNLWVNTSEPIPEKPDLIVVGQYRGFPVVVSPESGFVMSYTPRGSVMYQAAKLYDTGD